MWTGKFQLIFMTIFFKLIKISLLILTNRSCKCWILIELIEMKELIVLKVITVKNALADTIWLFNHEFEFQDSVCNNGHDLTILWLNISHITIITVKGVDYFCIIHHITKSKAIHLLENSVLEECGYIENVCQRNQWVYNYLCHTWYNKR